MEIFLEIDTDDPVGPDDEIGAYTGSGGDIPSGVTDIFITSVIYDFIFGSGQSGIGKFSAESFRLALSESEKKNISGNQDEENKFLHFSVISNNWFRESQNVTVDGDMQDIDQVLSPPHGGIHN